MKNLYNLNSKAYKEGYDILKLLPSSSKEKIPQDIWQFIKEHMDLNHNISDIAIYQNNLLEDTNLLLAILYKTYLASDEEKNIIRMKEKLVIKQKDIEARKKYNPNHLFKK